MFGLLGCTRFFDTIHGPQVVLDQVNFLMEPRERVGILAGHGAGKTTLARLLCGIDAPDDGIFLGERGDAISLGVSPFVHLAMTGEENVRHAAALYGLDRDEASYFCREFSELGRSYLYKVGDYTGGMKARLAFALSLILPGKLYVADERVYAGNAAMQAKIKAVLVASLETKGIVVIARSPRIVEEFCDRFAVLMYGKIIMCSSFSQACALFDSSQSNDSETWWGDDALGI